WLALSVKFGIFVRLSAIIIESVARRAPGLQHSDWNRV
ncbi:hypothetical protein, partial [Salmonella enterica subsp. enterica serovar Kentucky]